MTECPSFDDFYRAVHHGRSPLPWQSRLARRVIEASWPTEIGVPTGLGKTSTIDIAVWGLAMQSCQPAHERTLPTRIWYVVNRRLLVDAASEHAERIAVLLANPDEICREPNEATDENTAWRETLSAVSECLGKRSPAVEFELADGRRITGPLFVSRLRGGAQAGRRPPHPAQAAIICATVPMFGSRLLFRGYGTSNRMWPIDAALAGTDSLVLLDEAHISQPLQRLVEVIPYADAPQSGAFLPRAARPEPGDHDALLPTCRLHPTLVNLTATGNQTSSTFMLDEADHQHPLVNQRLNAHKSAVIADSSVRSLAHDLAAATLLHLDELEQSVGADVSAIVFVNQPRTARDVEAAIRKLSKQRVEPVVLTGQLRGPEADLVRHRLLDPEIGAPTDRAIKRAGTGPLVVIATQTLEVGADLDFDLLVSELAGVRSVTQRLGRLNRVGRRNHARAVLLRVSDAKPGGIYGEEANLLGGRLFKLTQPFDLGPGVISDILGAPLEGEPDRPELLPTHLWEFAKTSFPPRDAAPPEPFFDGFARQEFSVAVCWRSVEPEVAKPLIPPAAEAEFVDVPIADLRQLTSICRLRSDGTSIERIDPAVLRPGDRLVLSTTQGMYSTTGWDPAVATEVFDLSPLLRRTLRLTAAALENILQTPLDAEKGDTLQRIRDVAIAHVDDVEFMSELTDLAPTARELLGWIVAAPAPLTIHHSVWSIPDAFSPAIEFDTDGTRPRLVWRLPQTQFDPRIDALDELSLAEVDPSQRVLATHLETVGQRAERIATEVGLPEHIVGAVATAGRFHDLGKAHPGFQKWLGYSEQSVDLYAKSDPLARARRTTAPPSSGWPRGARHELLSVQLVDQADPDLPEIDLIRHLVLSHHGHGRPLCPTSASAPAAVDVTAGGLVISGAVTDPGLADWEQPERFRALCERFGYWGLALLEAVLRQADHIVSRADEVL